MTQKLCVILPLLLLFIVPALSVQKIEVPFQATPGSNEIQTDSPPAIPSTLGKTLKNAIPSQDRADYLKVDQEGNALSKAALFGQDGDSLDDIDVSDPNAKENDSTQQAKPDTAIIVQDDEAQNAASVGDDEPLSTQPKSTADSAQTNKDNVDDDPLADDQDDAKAAEPTPTTPTDSKDAQPAASTDEKTSEPNAAVVPSEKSSTLIKSLIISMCVTLGVILMAFVCYYRYQLEKYKIPPFTPPRCCPSCLFPRNFDRTKSTQSESYQMIEVYNPPELSSRF